MIPKLTKKQFQEYINSIPIYKKFCKGPRCPIAQYYYDTHELEICVYNDERFNIASRGESIKNAPWMQDFIELIDFGRDGWWSSINPYMCKLALKGEKIHEKNN